MTLREAVKSSRDALIREDRHLALLCSFEPLHLATFLQAYLVERFPAGAPGVRTFGYDQLSAGLADTVSVFRNAPALLFLSWEDLHPALSWRSRGRFGALEPGVLANYGREPAQRLAAWMEKRGAAESYIIVPPLEWLPPQDPCSTFALGPVATAAIAAMWALAEQLSAQGARIIRIPSSALDFRGVLNAGCPLTVEASEVAARQFVDVAFPRSERKKALVVDLDGTLWDGIIGEDGSEHLLHQPEGKGYPFHIFQKVLLKLRREGALLTFCSKNNPGDVLDVFDSLGMPLTLADFSAHRCNWESKTANIESIARELNIGCDSIVFIDDNPAELAEVLGRLPEVAAFGTPREASEWQGLFTQLQNLFAAWRVSAEDSLRTASLSNHTRREIATPSALRHLRELRLEITLKPNAFGHARSLELINKTNQFNLNGARLSPEEWLSSAAVPGAFCVSARLQDRHGDFGSICVAVGYHQNDSTLFLKQFVLSCRAFGRGVESIVLGELLGLHPAPGIQGFFRDTGKNVPARKFLEGLGCNFIGDGEWFLEEDAVRRHAESVCQQIEAIVRIERSVVQTLCEVAPCVM